MDKILYLSPGVFDKGGISRYTRFQARALRELVGADAVRVLSLLPPDEGSFEEPFAVDFASFGPTRAGKALFAMAAALSALEGRPELVWAAHVGLGPLGLSLSRALGAKLALNIYGHEVWTNLRKLSATSLRRADCVVSDCHNTLNYALEHGLRQNRGSVVHWDCVDTERLFPGAGGDASSVLALYGVPRPELGTTTVMTLGRMSTGAMHKGYDRLLEVMTRIAPEERVRLVLVGGGDQRARLEARAEELGLSARVFFTGRVHEDDLPAIYDACDVFSLVSDVGQGRGEGIPLTPLEAAACGKPILVGNQDGSREAAEDGVSGFVLDPFDLDTHAERIVRLARDMELRRSMGEAARARIEREHSFERFKERTRDLLAELKLV